MPFVKCRFYTESGEPIRGGCHRKGTGCAFIHPNEPSWTNARPSTFKAGDKSGDSGKRSVAIPPVWETGENAITSTTDSGGGWDTGGGWGGGWDTGEIMNRTLESTQPRSLSITKPWDASLSANDSSQANAIPASSGGTNSRENDGWGGGWGSTGNDGWGASSSTMSGSTGNNEWGVPGWGDNMNSDKNPGQDDRWGWGSSNNNNASNSWGNSEPMVVDNHAKERSGQEKGKSKVVIAPPRIRIPDNDSKKIKLSGTNDEPLGPSKWGETRSFNLASTSTPVTAITPVSASTPTDSTRVKRKRGVAFDDKLEVFKEYIKTWERAVRTRYLLSEAEAKRDRWFRTQKSACYARIGEAGRKKLDGQRTECDKEVSLQREKLSGAITTLVELHDKVSSNLDLGQRYNVSEEAKKFISESKAFVDEARAVLVAHVLKDRDEQPPGIQKRPSGSDVISIDTLRSQVQALEKRFEEAQTELTLRGQRDIRSQIDTLLTAKIQALRVAHQKKIDRIATQPRLEIVIPSGALEDMESRAQRVGDMETMVPHTVEDIRVLLLRVDAMTKRVSELENDVSRNKEAYRKIQDMAAEREVTEQRMDSQLENIRGQFEQLVASQLAGSAMAEPTMSPIGYDLQRSKLMDSLRPVLETVLEKFYEQEVKPTIDSLQQVVIKASDRHQEEAIQVLWGRIQPAMNMVAGVSRWLDSQELGLTAPVEEDHTAASC